MAQLIYTSSEEVQLRLGACENEILTVIRRWGWWLRAEVEGKLPGSSEVAMVLLSAERSHDTTIREILERSFQLVFPADGGEGCIIEHASAAPTKPKQR